MTIRLGLLALLSLVACGGSEVAVAARIGWQFDYRDWTNTSSTSELRGCDNVPSSGPVEPPYAPVTSVHVVLADPAGQIPGLDQTVPCSRGAGDAFMDIRGLPPKVFSVTLEAQSEDGQVLYRYDLDELDFAGAPEERFVLAAATGETHFFPRVSGSLSCPANAQTLRYSVRPVVDSQVQETPVLSDTQPACDGDTFAEIILRHLPTEPEPAFNGSFVPDQYEFVVEVLNGSDVIFCGRSQRPVKPGNANLNQDLTLNAGACP